MILRFPAAGKTATQLHDELLVRFPEWKGVLQPDGTYLDPLLRVEHTTQHITLTIPDDANEAAVRAVVAAHMPKPPPDWKTLRREALQRLAAAANFTPLHLRALGFEPQGG